LKGKVVGECRQRHRRQEFLGFLRRLDREFPGKVPLYLIMDNCGTHGCEKVREWLKRHPQFVAHFVPTGSSWLNLVESSFGHLYSKAIRRGVCLSQAWNEPLSERRRSSPFRKDSTAAAGGSSKIRPGCTLPKTRKARICLLGYFCGCCTRVSHGKNRIFNGFNTAARIPKLGVAGWLPVSRSNRFNNLRPVDQESEPIFQ
jgi:transposase